jgi:hypothetical protein
LADLEKDPNAKQRQRDMDNRAERYFDSGDGFVRIRNVVRQPQYGLDRKQVIVGIVDDRTFWINRGKMSISSPASFDISAPCSPHRLDPAPYPLEKR